MLMQRLRPADATCMKRSSFAICLAVMLVATSSVGYAQTAPSTDATAASTNLTRSSTNRQAGSDAADDACASEQRPTGGDDTAAPSVDSTDADQHLEDDVAGATHGETVRRCVEALHAAGETALGPVVSQVARENGHQHRGELGDDQLANADPEPATTSEPSSSSSVPHPVELPIRDPQHRPGAAQHGNSSHHAGHN